MRRGEGGSEWLSGGAGGDKATKAVRGRMVGLHVQSCLLRTMRASPPDANVRRCVCGLLA